MGIPINPIHLLILHSLLGGGRPQPNHMGWGPGNGMRPAMGGMGQQPNHFGWGSQGDLLSQIMQMRQGGANATGDPMGFGGRPGKWQVGDNLGGLLSPPQGGVGGGSPGTFRQVDAPPYILNSPSGQFQPGLPNNSASGGAPNALQGIMALLNR